MAGKRASGQWRQERHVNFVNKAKEQEGEDKIELFCCCDILLYKRGK